MILHPTPRIPLIADLFVCVCYEYQNSALLNYSPSKEASLSCRLSDRQKVDKIPPNFPRARWGGPDPPRNRSDKDIVKTL